MVDIILPKWRYVHLDRPLIHDNMSSLVSYPPCTQWLRICFRMFQLTHCFQKEPLNTGIIYLALNGGTPKPNTHLNFITATCTGPCWKMWIVISFSMGAWYFIRLPMQHLSEMETDCESDSINWSIHTIICKPPV